MAHKTLIDGTAYEVKGGRTLVDGTGYSIKGGRTLVDGTGYDISFLSGILASDIAVGSSVYLMENGTAAEYMVVHQGLPSSMYDASCDGCWLLRKDRYEKRQWNSSDSNSYKDSTIHSYLNSTFLGLFDSGTQDAIKEVKIPYVNGTANSSVASGANGLAAKIFLLSDYEVGFTTDDNRYIPVVGAKLSYFSSGTGTAACNLRMVIVDGLAVSWWLRDPMTLNTTYARNVMNSGSCGGDTCSKRSGIRPAFVLPSTAVFDETTMLLKGVA